MSMELMIIVGSVILIVLIIVISIYNILVEKQKKIERSKSLVDVYLKKRFDLIPNLVEVCKGYSKYEKETLENIVKLRSSFNESPTSEARDELNKVYNNLLAVLEKYPDIKAGENYLKLQKELTNVENEIQASRRIYINSITSYNNSVMKFPSSILAKLFGFKKYELPKYDYSDIKVDFNK